MKPWNQMTDREQLEQWARHVGESDPGSPGPALNRLLKSYDKMNEALNTLLEEKDWLTKENAKQATQLYAQKHVVEAASSAVCLGYVCNELKQAVRALNARKRSG